MRTRISIVIVMVLAVFVSGPILTEGAKTKDFSRYQIILDRRVFGEAPAEPVIGPDDHTVKPPPPSFILNLKMCAITKSEEMGIIHVGFINIKSRPQKGYYLRIGESQDGITLVDANYESEAAKLRKGSEEDWIYMSGKTGDAPPAPSPRITTPKPSGPITRKLSYTERLRMRRKALNNRKKEPPKLAGTELEEHLKQYQMEIIRRGEPPLPIPLTKEMDDQLVAEGVLPPLE